MVIRRLLAYPAMIGAALVAALLGRAYGLDDVAVYALTAAIGLPLALAMIAWSELPCDAWRRR